VKKILLLLALSVCAALPAYASSDDLLSLSAGYYGILDDDGAADFRAEYRWAAPLVWQIKPFAGVEATSEGALYGLGGILLDLAVNPHWYLTPSFGAGFYSDGGGNDLGYALEFRSQLEVAYEFDSRDRLSLGFSHISNASLGDRNPGVEVLSLYYHMPISRIWGK
jgi:lipid A 3-O-deacylase